MRNEIIVLVCIIVLYSYFMSNNYVNDEMLKVKYIPLALVGLFAFFIFVVMIASIFYYRTTHYTNQFNKNIEDDSKFNYIKKFNLSIPDEYINPLLEISKIHGKRIEIPQKRQKCISLSRLQESFPQIIEWYKTLPPIISSIVGTKIKTTPLTEINSVCVIVYDQPGDYIDWHYDTNHYNGRFFTLLLPLTSEPTCGNYQYKNSNEVTQTVPLLPGEALLFEGDKIYHRAKKLCKNQRRVILSCTFTTSTKIPMIEYIFQKIKNIGIFGEL